MCVPSEEPLATAGVPVVAQGYGSAHTRKLYSHKVKTIWNWMLVTYQLLRSQSKNTQTFYIINSGTIAQNDIMTLYQKHAGLGVCSHTQPEDTLKAN